MFLYHFRADLFPPFPTYLQFKAKGNAALQSKNPSLAIEHYTSAINLDGTNHVYYSNRSAAYLSKGDGTNALNDANSCLGLNPNFAKGFSRKGAALHSLKRYNDSIQAYEEGLAKFPNDLGLKNGLDSVKKEKDGPPPGASRGAGAGGMPPGLSGLFGPEMMAKIALDPKLRGYMNDPEFMSKIQLLQKDPNQLTTMLSDPRIMEVFQVMLGVNGMEMRTGDESEMGGAEAPKPASAAPKKQEETKTKPEPEPMEEEEEDLSELEPEERKKREDQKAAVKVKQEGNDLYKAKKFDEAIAK